MDKFAPFATNSVIRAVCRLAMPAVQEVLQRYAAVCFFKFLKGLVADGKVIRSPDVYKRQEEGVNFRMLTNPTAIHGDENGSVRAMTCVEMELGEPDASGRRRPVVKQGSEFDLDVDTVVIAIGNSPNPLIRNTTPGLETQKWGGIIVDENGATSLENVYAGGDAVTGAATVILAMGAGKTAAKAIHEKLSK